MKRLTICLSLLMLSALYVTPKGVLAGDNPNESETTGSVDQTSQPSGSVTP